MKGLQYALLGALIICAISLPVHAQATSNEPTYDHIRSLVGHRLLESNANAQLFLKENKNLPHWAPYPNQCDTGTRRVNSKGNAICVRRQHGAKNKLVIVTPPPASSEDS